MLHKTCSINYGHLANLQKTLPTTDLNKKNFHLIKYLLATFFSFIFNLYLSSPNAGITVGHFRLLLLLYADDVVVFADSREELQDELHKLCEYCKRWNLRLDISKSKVVVFKKGNSRAVYTLKYGDEEIQNILTIPYLGVKFTSNGLFTQAQCKLADQANKSLFLLYKKLGSFKDVKPSLAIDLFDEYICPVLSCGNEVWGFHKAPEIEQVQLNFCKRLMRFKRTTQNDFVYGQLGRYPVYIFRYIYTKYWLKIITGQKSHYVSLLCNDSLANIDRNTRYGWSRKVRSLLFSCDFGEPCYTLNGLCCFQNASLWYVSARIAWQNL